MINGKQLPLDLMLAWVFFLAVLGVTMAIPMKRQMINIEQLRFPSGTAAAETLRALHSRGEQGMRAARALGLAGGLAGLSTFLTDGLRLVSQVLEPYSLSAMLSKANTFVLGNAWMGRTVMFVWDPIFMAAGAITGMRVCASMLVSGTLCWAVYVPLLQSQGIIEGSGFRTVVQWTLWGGTACMVTSGLLNFLLQWKSSLRAFRSMTRMFRRGSGGDGDRLEFIEAPMSWYVLGQAAALAALAWLAHRTFAIPVWISAVAFVLSFLLALVACRVTGETDTTPVGAMGQITQLTIGAVLPPNVSANSVTAMNTTLMSANMVSSAAISSADLLTDLKSGYLLGANPRKQFLAQFAGIFTGTVVTVLAFIALVPDASALGSDQFPAPAAQNWRAVATAMSQGLAALGPLKMWSIIVGGSLGVVLALLPLVFPKQTKYLPSAAGAGLAWTFHWYYSLLFFLGALVAYLVEKTAPKQAEAYTFPVASGVIAGGSLMGVALVFWENGPAIWRQFFH
jgi:putative OPT family oligopeptide transporter